MKQSSNLSSAQYGIFVACMEHQNELCYNVPYLYILDGSLDEHQLVKAVELTVKSHPTFFTRIETGADGEPLQTIDDQEPSTWTLTVEHVSDFDSQKKTLLQPFHIIGDRLFRIRLFHDGMHYYLFNDTHHIINDGTSMQIFLHDIEQAYQGKPLAPEPITMMDVARQETMRRETEQFDIDKQWYAQHFDCSDTYTELMSDFEGTQPANVNTQRILSVSLSEVETFCQQQHLFKSAFFTGAYAYLLAKFAGDQQALFNTVYAGREPELARTIGMMVTTIPVYLNFDAGTTVLQFLQQCQENMSGTRSHNSYTYADVVHDLQLQSNSMFVWHGNLFGDTQLMGKPMRTEPQSLELRTRVTDIYIKAFILDGKIHLDALYAAEKYSKELIDQFLESYEAIVTAMLHCNMLSEVEIITESQRNLLDSFNDTDIDYDSSETIVSIFRQRAKEMPDKCLLVVEDKRFTYRDVDIISERLATYLVNKGMGCQDVVSILIPRCEWMMIASLGVLKAGCTYQPLDPTYPEERLNFMMQDASSKLLIADEALRSLVSEYQGDVLLTKDIKTLPEEAALTTLPAPSDRMVLLYTSGSTGVPKGCELLHSNVISMCRMFVHVQDISGDSRLSAYASYGFDAHLQEIYCPIVAGCEVYLISEEMRLDLIALNDYFNAQGITHTFMTTQVAYQFATGVLDNHSLKNFITGGEKLASLDPPANFTLYNAYGPSETVCFVTLYPVLQTLKNIPIGKAVDNVKLYVVDANGHRLPVGAAGELWIAGPQVSKGYLNRPEKTAEVFIDNPFNRNEKYARVYRTGDIVRFLPDGNLQFVGRRDGQVKIRGFRIELKEVESVIRQFPGIKDATVQAFDEENGGKFIAAYVVADEPVDIDKLNKFIIETKPPYMVPAVTMQIERIPLNQNQKVNRKALPQPIPQTPSYGAETESAAPLNMLEQQIKEIVVSIVGHDNFGITTVLGLVGLTSISAIRLAVLINKRYGITLSAKELVKNGTIQQIENEIMADLLNPQHRPSEEPATEKTMLREAPLSAPQQGIYFECMKNPMEMTYNVPTILYFAVPASALVEAVKKVISIHPMLSVHFEQRDEGVVQIIDNELYENPEVTVSERTSAHLQDYKQQFVMPFNLNKGPLYHAEVVDLGDDKAALLLDVHHLVFDGGSLDLFVRQVCDLLDGREIEPESYGYMEYVNDTDEEETAAARKFFAEQLQTCDGASEIPADLRTDKEHGEIATVFHSIDFDKIQKRCHQLGVTPAQMLLAVTEYCVARYSASKEAYICTISSGRSNLKIADTVGMFVNTLALAARIGEQTVDDFIREVGASFDATMSHENYPFAQVAADHGFLPNITYAYQVGVLSAFQAHGKEVTSETLELKVPKFRIDILVMEQQGTPGFQINYDDAFYSRSFMEGLAESLATVAEHFATEEGPVKKISMLSEERRAEVMKFSQGEVLDIDFTKTVANCIRQQAQLRPDKVAVVAADGQLTYSEMNRKANILAHLLIQKGVAPDSFVALMLERTTFFPISVCAVHKVGAAYLPLDLEYPIERLLYMLEDSEAPVLVTTHEVLEAKQQEGDFKAKCVVFLDDIDFSVQTEDMDLSRPDGMAYMIYTSGSTGKPKGAMLHHRGLLNLTEFLIHIMQIDENDRISHHRSFSFDAHIGDLYPVLAAGGTLCIMPSEIRKDLQLIYNYLVDNKITGGGYTTPMTILLLNNFDLPVRWISGGGEKMVGVKSDHVRIFNEYGPTECTNDSNVFVIEPGKVYDNIPIGRPIANTWGFIMDQDGNLLPQGVSGELCLTGAHVGYGYWHLPERTAQSFIDCPLFDKDRWGYPMRMYRTGDLCVYNKEHMVEYVSRIDNQVKVNGFRIELGEIDNVAHQFKGIEEVAATVKTIGKSKQICLFYTVEPGASVQRDALRAHLQESSLAVYMQPSVLMQLDAMPHTPSGKIAHKMLPTPDMSALNEYVAPTNDTERLFCDLYAEVLSLERVGINDDFFLMGGSSLIAIRVVIAAAKAGYKITYADIFQYKTPAALSRFVLGETDETEQQDHELLDFDYDSLQPLLQANNIDAFQTGECRPLGHVLLTGATGYLGIHVLHELLERHDGKKIYCLLRGKDLETAVKRLQILLYYYFEKKYDDRIGDDLFIVQGDITTIENLPMCPDNPSQCAVDTIINCAAIVKHFSAGTEIEDIDYYAVRRLADLAVKQQVRLIQISTYSTVDRPVVDNGQGTVIANEQYLYMNQELTAKYPRAKFLAERYVLDLVAHQGLDAKIMRVGNLSPRYSDGEFQINGSTNSSMGRLKLHVILGCCPYDNLDKSMEFSPIDEVAHAILLLSTTPKACTIFHPYDHHRMLMVDLYEEMTNNGLPILPVEQAEFDRVLEEAKNDPKKARVLTSMLAYNGIDSGAKTLRPILNNGYTMQVLYRMGYHWPMTTDTYVSRFIKALQGLGFFEI